MRYRIFSQSLRPELPLVGLGDDAGLELEIQPDEAAPLPRAYLGIARRPAAAPRALGEHDDGGVFRYELLARPASDDDRAAATRAARRGGAAGMDGLAARCPTVIELTCSEAPPAITYTLCAALAARCLGPVLPPDESTLLGVRSARALATAR